MPVDVVDEIDAVSMVGVCDAAAQRLLSLLDLGQAELVVVLCDDARIQELNRSWRGCDAATDVLSFSQEEGEEVATGDQARVLGDIVISIDRAAVQAEAGGWTLAQEAVRLLLHGLLHLLGYDHEDGGAEEVRMKAEEARLASQLIADGIGCASEDLP